MLFRKFTSSALLGLLILNPTLLLAADSYVLNPHHGETSGLSGLPLSDRDQNDWLSAIYRKVDLQDPSIDRNKLKDESGESLASKLSIASQSYLEMNAESAEAKMHEALQILEKAPPYPQMYSDAMDVLALLYSIQKMNEHKKSGHSKEVNAFILSKEFTAKLPVKFQSKADVDAKGPSVGISRKKLHLGDSARIFVYGKERELTNLTGPGKVLVQILNGDELSAAWVLYDETASQVDVETVWKRTLWTSAPSKNIQAAVAASRPKGLSSAQVTVLSKNENGGFNPILVSGNMGGASSITRGSAAPSSSKVKDKAASFDAHSASNLSKKPSAYDDQVQPWKDDDEEEVTSSGSFLKSPLFWIGVGVVVAGLGGWGIYEATKSTQHVTTP